MFPTVICYYTENTGYESEVENLIASCKKWSLTYQIDSIPSMGSWEKNCCHKPHYILKKITKLQKPILWIDADAVIVRKPVLFHNFSYDIGVRIVKELEDNHPSKVISGTIYFNYTDRAIALLKDWDRECQRLLAEEQKEVWDQIALRNVLFSSQATIYPLPSPYYAVYDKIKEKEAKKDAIIIHYQASRLLKKTVDKLVVPFWEKEHISQQARKKFFSSIRFLNRKK